ncbi:MAG: 16S rRNA (uracil(1498)-N(3))-methyltransferase, partial [Deltaproteobacteria bacterium]|nr:16S rRNA (uracil(1498)-N(3))-methyltransferase [Deltaproteobacteria bacterium]
AAAVITAIAQRERCFTVKREVIRQTPPLPALRLLTALPRHDIFDNIVQKAVELGVSRLSPLLSARTVVRFADEQQTARKLKHWQQVSIAAIKQSGNPFLPVIDAPCELPQALADSASALKIALHPRAEPSLRRLRLPAAGAINLVFGPEGGFSPEETALLKENGYCLYRLGNNILRLETAIVCALSAVHLLRDEIASCVQDRDEPRNPKDGLGG